MFCKIFLLTLAVCFVQGQNMVEMAKLLRTTCQAETSVPDQMLTDAHRGNFADDVKLKCYMKCVFSQIGALDDDSTFHKDAILMGLPAEMKEDANKMLTACEKEVGADVCDKAFKINKCLYKANPNSYFLI